MKLSGDELAALVRRVFSPAARDRVLAIMTDLPDDEVPDRPEWKDRRRMAADWARALSGVGADLGLETRLCFYRNVRRNNADLPSHVWLDDGGPVPDTAEALAPKAAAGLEAVLRSSDLIVALTEFSATAPLKVAAGRCGFRAATMPGFSRAMVPALRLDYGEINRRVRVLADLLNRAAEARIVFNLEGGPDLEPEGRQTLELTLDLRHRTAHASGGLFPEPGMVGNLPSGEAYIVPYEGERPGDPSRSRGHLPVQFADGVTIYEIRENRAVSVSGSGLRTEMENAHLIREPAYGNLAELGLGVLGEFGVEPTGEILLDEKLGLHIAFGRSDHFGGQVGPADFSSPEEVVHIDRVFLPAVQPAVSVVSVDLVNPDAGELGLMRDHLYVIDFAVPPEF